MAWEDKIYDSLITEKRSESSRRRTSLRKRGAEMEKRKASGKSIGAYGAGTRARTAKAQAKKASKPAMWHAKRHYEGEAGRLIDHGKRYKANQKAAKKVSENIYDLEKGTMKPKVKRGDPFAHLPKEIKMKILAGKALRGGGAKRLAQNIDRSGGSKK
jgi:hypothetical protein